MLGKAQRREACVWLEGKALRRRFAMGIRRDTQDGQSIGVSQQVTLIFKNPYVLHEWLRSPVESLLWIKWMGSWSTQLVMMFIYMVLTDHLNFGFLQVSHHCGIGFSPVLNSFCSWFCCVYYTTTIDVLKWVRNIDVEIYEMNEEHEYDDNSSNVPQDDLYLIVCCIHLITMCNASGGSPTPKPLWRENRVMIMSNLAFHLFRVKNFFTPKVLSIDMFLKRN